MKPIITTILAVAAIFLTGCNRSKQVLDSEKPKAPKSLVEIATEAGKERIIYDAQGNVVELDLRGLLISDAFVENLKAQDLRHLQVLKVSGAFITDQTINRLHGQPIKLRQIVFEATSIKDPESHPWVRQYREDTGTEVVFTNESKSEQAGAGQPATRSESDSEDGDKPQPEAEGRSR